MLHIPSGSRGAFVTLNETADKVANNAVLSAVAKVGMFLSPLLLTIGLFILSNYLSAQSSAMGSLSNRITVSEQVEAGLDKRLSILEDLAARGRQDRLDFQSKTQDQLDRLQNQNAQILAQLAGIVARMDESDRSDARKP
jgi:hypothetical protein